MSDPATETATHDRWLGVEVRHLAALAAIAEEGSFRGAADSLGYVQSAVSQQLVQLERQLDARLIERSRGTSPVRLTPAGSLLLEHVEEILDRFRQAHADITGLADGSASPLRLGVIPAAAVSLMPRVAAAFTARFRGVQIVTTEEPKGQPLTALVAAGELDLAFCELPQPEPDVQTLTLLRDPLILLTRADSPLADRPVSVDDLAGIPLVGYEHCPNQDRFLAFLSDRGIDIDFVFRARSSSSLEALVASGAGAAVMPHLAVTRHRQDTVAVELPETPVRTIALAWRRQCPQLLPAQLFVQLTRDLCHGITRQREANRRNGRSPGRGDLRHA